MVAWQSSQVLVVLMCVAFLPVAVVPLWQLKQEPVTALWSKLTLVQLLVVWQVSHWALVLMCVDDFPVAVVPLWHEEQVPTTEA